MISVSRKKETESISFVKAFSDNTGLPDNYADAVICSQSFHWMEPKSTLAEVNRIHKSSGAAVGARKCEQSRAGQKRLLSCRISSHNLYFNEIYQNSSASSGDIRPIIIICRSCCFLL